MISSIRIDVPSFSPGETSKPGIRTSADNMSLLLCSTSNPDKVVNKYPAFNEEVTIGMLLQVCIPSPCVHATQS